MAQAPSPRAAVQLFGALLVTACALGCGSSESSDTPGAAGAAAGGGGAAGAAGAAGTAGAAGASGASSGTGGQGGSAGSSSHALDPVVPAATGTCPDFTNGEVTFSPAGIASRSVRLWVGEQGGGPLVFYWHGTGSSPIEASYGLSATAIAEIRALGGVVAAPTHDPEAGQWPWFLVAGTRIDDLVLADEIAACAVQKKQIDVRRIHVAGMSAGGLQTSQMSLRRSSYVASVAPYSGGLVPYANPPYEEPANHFPALIYWGGTDDVVVISFETASLNYSERLRANENFTVLCNHGQGHTIPADGGVTTWRFFQDHPFGTVPSPYADGLPSAFPAYCGL